LIFFYLFNNLATYIEQLPITIPPVDNALVKGAAEIKAYHAVSYTAACAKDSIWALDFSLAARINIPK
jgi:hypothetical protein